MTSLPIRGAMSKNVKYLLVSLPTSITNTHDKQDALDAISATVTPDYGTTSSFPIPEFKIGTLDTLVQQADELAKLDSICQAVAGKVGDALRGILDGDENQIERMKTVNDSMSIYIYGFVFFKKNWPFQLRVG
jgi:V-type H+-transporting ATPase subunit C